MATKLPDGFELIPTNATPAPPPGFVVEGAPAADFSGVSSRVLPATVPERSWGQAIADTALGIREGARNVTSATLGLPVNVINAGLNNPATRAAGAIMDRLGITPVYEMPVIQQPDFIRGTQAELRSTNERDAAETASDKLKQMRDEFARKQGFFDSLLYVAGRPEAALDLGAQQVGQVLNAVPGGGVGANILAGGMSAGAQAADQVSADLAERADLTERQKALAASDAFQASAALNAALPLVPGASVIERGIGGDIASDAATRSIGRSIAAGALGEGVAGMASEAGDQVIQNLATGQPWQQGVGQAALTGALFDGPLGAVAGAGEAVQARREQPPGAVQIEPVVSPPPAGFEVESAPATAPPAPPAGFVVESDPTDERWQRPVTETSPEPAQAIPAAPAPVIEPNVAESASPAREAGAALLPAEEESAPPPADETPAQGAEPPPARAIFADYEPGETGEVIREDNGQRFAEDRFTRRSVDEHVQTGDVGALLDDLAQQPTAGEDQRWLAAKLAPLARDLGITLKAAPEGSRLGGAWDARDRSLYVRQAAPDVILHEMLHGATSALIDSPSAQANPQVRQFVSELDQLREHVREAALKVDLGKLDQVVQDRLLSRYGPLANPKELLSYSMTDRAFQEFLQTLPAPEGWRGARNAWDAFKQAIAKLFGATTPGQRSMLDAIMESSADLVDFAAANPQTVRAVQAFEQARHTGRMAPERANPQPERQQAPAVPPQAPQPERTTSTKNAVVEQERRDEGRAPIVKEAAKSNEQTVAEAESTLRADPDAARAVVRRVLEGDNKSISNHESALLLLEKVRVMQRRDAAADRITKAATSEQIAQAQRDWAAAEQELNDIDQATVASGSDWGRFGQFRQRLIRDDFSLASMERKERVARGQPLTDEQQAQVKALHTRIAALEKQLAESQEKLSDAEATTVVKATYEQMLREMGSELRQAKKQGRPKLEAMKQRADEARERIRKRALNLNSGIDPSIIADAVQIGAYHIANGATNLADWSRRMASDLGDAIEGLRSRLPDIFAASQRQAKAAERVYGGQSAAPTVAEAVAALEPGNVTARDVRDLVRAHIAAGMRGEGEIMKAVTADLRDGGADIDEAGVRKLFAAYGKAAAPTRTEDQQVLTDLRNLVRMQDRIEQLQAGAGVTPRAKARASEEVRQKRAVLGELLKQAYAAARNAPDRQEALRQERVRNLQARIADLEDMISTGRRPERRTRPHADDGEVLALQQRRDALQRELAALDRPPRDPEQVYQRSRATGIRRQIEQIEARIKAGDYARRPRVPRTLSAENERLAYQLDLAKREFNRRALDAQLAARSGPRRLLDNTASGINLARAIMTSFDLSGVLRQGGFITLGRPARAATSIMPMLRAFVSEQKQHAVMRDIESRPNYPLYKQAKLALTRNDGKLSEMEEAYMSRWIQRSELQPGQPVRNAARTVKNVALSPIRGSERAYTTFLNKLRADSFDAMAAGLSRTGPLTPDEIKAIGNYVNVATGRGKIGLSDNAATGLNTVFFAPKLVASRFQLLVGQPLRAGSARTRKLIAGEYGRYMAGLAVLYGLGYLAYIGSGEDEDDRPFIESDPRSSSFGRMRFGNTYIDPLSGLAQVTTFLSRVASGETKTAGGELNPLRDGFRLTNGLYDAGQVLDKAGFETLASIFPDQPNYEKRGFGDATVFDTLANFARSKLAPVPGAVLNAASGENAIGQSTTPAKEAGNLLVPMSFGNVADVMQENGVPGGAAITMGELLGLGVQYRDRSSFAAPDYQDLKFADRKLYNDWLRRQDKVRQGMDQLRTLANSFPEDAAPADVRDSVTAKAAELGIDGVSVGSYKSKTGLKRSESGKVTLQVAKGSATKQVMDIAEDVSKLNRQIEELYSGAPVTYGELNKLRGKYLSGEIEGDAGAAADLDDKIAVAKLLANERSRLMRASLED